MESALQPKQSGLLLPLVGVHGLLLLYHSMEAFVNVGLKQHELFQYCRGV